MKSYRDLDIYQESYQLALDVHKLSLKLPNYEMYETGSQVRRSSKSITANIVEGYGRKIYKAEFIRFLIFSHSSCEETIIHLNFIRDLHNNLIEEADIFIERYTELSKKIYRFIEYVEKEWKG
jgi:four helix bundle protein